MKKSICLVFVVFAFAGCALQTDEEPSDYGNSYPIKNNKLISKEVARTWPEKFCSLEVNATRNEVQAIMGEPTLTSYNSFANQDQYEAWDYSLTVFYDIDDRVTQLQSKYDNIPCSWIRD